MRTIKLYEDYYSNQRFKKELVDFCEMYLAYLIDEGFEVKVISEEHSDLVLDIEKVSVHANYIDGVHGTRYIDNSFKWGEVVDHFTTFYHMLSKEYKLIKMLGNIGGYVNLRQEMTLGRRVGWTWKNYDDGEIMNLDPETKVDKIQIKVEIE
jgi:hypothetical protein